MSYRIKPLIFLVVSFACTVKSKKQDVSQQFVLTGHVCELDETILEELKVEIARSSTNMCIVDSSSTPLCIENERLHIYFVKINEIEDGLIINTSFAAICVDDSTKAHSKSPILFREETILLSDSAWDKSMRLLNGPRLLIREEKNGETEVIIRERLHNGTVYHSVVARVYNVKKDDFALQYKFSFEEISWLPSEESYIKRVLKGNEVWVYVTKDLQNDGDLIGKYTVNLNGDKMPKDVEIKVAAYSEVILTSSPEGEIP